MTAVVVLVGLAAAIVYPMDDDWVFASPARRGELPYWSFSIFSVYIRPALKAAEIAGTVGWHSFRHSYATILKSHGKDVKTVQELLRHANSRYDHERLRPGRDGPQAESTKQSGKAGFQFQEGSVARMRSLMDLLGPAAKVGNSSKLLN